MSFAENILRKENAIAEQEAMVRMAKEKRDQEDLRRLEDARRRLLEFLLTEVNGRLDLRVVPEIPINSFGRVASLMYKGQRYFVCVRWEPYEWNCETAWNLRYVVETNHSDPGTVRFKTSDFESFVEELEDFVMEVRKKIDGLWKRG